ncbi:peptidylprolyl isomerase [Actibacterium sp. D379-3]
MTRLTRRLSALATALTLALTPALTTVTPAHAQQGGPFAPRVIVNDQAVTNWEVEQRMLFMRLLNSPGDLEQTAVDGLIEDRLRMDAARELGIAPSDEEVAAGMAEFAGRANLTVDAFIGELGKAGLASESFRDFVTAGLAWRQVVRARFGPRTQVTEAEIDRAVALSSRKGAARVLLSEVILRADTPEFKIENDALAKRLSETITTTGAFAAAARSYSVSPSAERGGRIDWLDLANLPPQIASQVLALGPGEVTDPIPVPNAIALFQLRAIEESDVTEPDTLAVEYARYALPGADPAKAEKLRAELDTCDDLYGIAKGQPEERLVRETQQIGQVPQDLALELAKLDPGESVVLNRGGPLSVLMLCGRTPELGEELDREQVRLQLVNQRITSYADSFMQELKADAIIRTP